jgi:hypothetical protein
VTDGIDFSGMEGEDSELNRDEICPGRDGPWFVRIGGRRSGRACDPARAAAR